MGHETIGVLVLSGGCTALLISLVYLWWRLQQEIVNNRRLDKALQRSERQLDSIGMILTDVVWIMDEHAHILETLNHPPLLSDPWWRPPPKL